MGGDGWPSDGHILLLIVLTVRDCLSFMAIELTKAGTDVALSSSLPTLDPSFTIISRPSLVGNLAWPLHLQ